MSAINERVKHLRRALNMTQDQLGEVLGVKKSTLSMIETGKAALSARNLRTLVDKLGISPAWLQAGEGEMTFGPASGANCLPLHRGRTDHELALQQIPLYNIEGTAGLVPLFLNQRAMTPVDYIQIPNLPRCDGAIYVTGDSMYPLLKSGDIVLYKQLHDLASNIFWGEMYLISIDLDGEEYITVKYIQKSDLPEHVRLVSQNTHHADKDVHLDRIKALALVKACIRMNAIR